MKTISTLFPSAHKSSAWLRSAGLAIICLLAFGLASSNLGAQAVSGQVTLSSTLAVIAGGGSATPTTTAGAATSAKLNAPNSVATDAAGNLYIADATNNLIEQVSPAGQIVVLAGGGGTVPSATAEAATSAKLSNPAGLAVDASGNVYIADAGNKLVEQLSPGGQIVVIAGGGGTVPSFTSGAAASAQLSNPTGVAVDAAGDVYIADQGNNLIEEVTTGQIVAIVGGGIKTPPEFSSFTRDADTVALMNPSAVAVDGAGDVYFVDQGRSDIDELTGGQVGIVFGGGSTPPSLTAQPAANAEFNAPTGLTLDSKGNFYIADQGNNLVEEISGGQIIVLLAGGGSTVPTTAGGTPGAAQLNSPADAVADAAGNVYIADRGNNLVEKVERSQTVLPATAVGSTSSSQTIQVQLQSASAISGITVPKTSNGAQEFTIGTITGCTVGGASNPAGTVCIVPVTFSPAYPGLRSASLIVNNGSAVVGTAGLYGTGLGPVLTQSPGSVSVIAGGGSTVPGTTATAPLSTLVANPLGEAVDGAGNLYVVSGTNGHGMVNEISATNGQITLVAGAGATVPTTTPMPATSASITPYGIAVDGAGNLYIADYGNGLVEEVDATTHQIVAIAGNNSGNGASTTPEPALTAAIYPFGVAVDTTGNIYILDRDGEYGDGTVDKIPAGTGQIVVVAGAGFSQASPQSPLTFGFYQPTNVAVDGAGNYYIADAGDDRVEEVNVSTGLISVLAGFGPDVPGTTPTTATNASLNNPFSVAVDAAGDVYIAEGSNNFVDEVNPAGQIVRIAGGGTTAPTSAVSVATSAQLNNPTGIAIDGAGNLYITDSTNNLVEKIAATALPLSFSDTYVGATNATPQTIAIGNIGNQTLNIASVSTAADFPATGSCAAAAQALTPGTSCLLVYGFLPTTAGALNEMATLTDNSLNATNAQQTISLTGTGVAAIVPVNPGTYTIAANPTTVTVKAGQTGTATVTLTPTGGYTGSVILSCANLPANTQCVFSQTSGGTNTVMLSGDNQAVPVTLTIQTNVQQTIASAREQNPLNPILPALAFWFPGGIVGLAGFGAGKKKGKKGSMRGRSRLLGIALLVLLTGAMAGGLMGCGGGSHSPTTPAGTSTVTVISTAPAGSSGLSQSATFTLTVTH
jgi:sugar lactone lactonase YvrE